MKAQRARWMNVVALGFLATALVMILTFHFAVFRENGMGAYVGWEIWPEILETFVSLGDQEPLDLVLTGSFVTAMMVLATGPFLVGVFRRSRLVWWGMTILSGMVVVGLSVILGWVLLISDLTDLDDLKAGFWLLILAPVVNFIGMLFIRPEEVGDQVLEWDAGDG